MFENVTRRSDEIVLRRGEKGRGRMMEGVDLTKYKCHNVSPLYNYYMLVKKRGKR
jgi:hypothetical protein